MEFNRHNIAILFFLELISIAPLIIILGNVVPFWPLKLHHIGFGLTFLCSVWILIQDPNKKWLIYFAFFYCILQFTFEHFYLKNLIDYFFGPFVIVVMIDLLVNKKIPQSLLKKYTNRFSILLWLPITIAIFQFFALLPLTFWDANYVNSANINGEHIPRPNGLLYHGSELAIIICFTTLFQYFKEEARSFWILILMVFISIITYYKAIVGCTLLLLLFYLTFVNRGNLSRYKLVSKSKIIWYSSIAFVIAAIFVVQFIYTVYSHTGYPFPNEMLTGRGGIWNVYLEGIYKSYSPWNYLFGSGMGSGLDIFKTYATKTTFYPLNLSPELKSIPHSHNALLSIFINSGFVGVLFHLFLFKTIYSQVKQWKPSPKWNKTVFAAVFFIPCLTIGVTIILFETAIIWPCIGFLFYKWNNYTNSINVKS